MSGVPPSTPRKGPKLPGPTDTTPLRPQASPITPVPRKPSATSGEASKSPKQEGSPAGLEPDTLEGETFVETEPEPSDSEGPEAARTEFAALYDSAVLCYGTSSLHLSKGSC
jgi:hypothetical protein